QRQLARLADDEHLVAGLVEHAAAAVGERFAVQLDERLRSAVASARPADQQDARQRPASIRHGSVYTFRRPLRTKPHSVIPRSVASSTASDDGAPTATRTGQPATAAFCTSSNDSLPLTQSTSRPSGRRPAVNAQPITLSIALCRPTSSRRQTRLPSSAKRPVACRPPVASNAACDSRSRSGSPATKDA